MDLEQFRINRPGRITRRPCSARASPPRFEAGESPLPITCCRCGTTSVYVVVTDGTTTLGFVVCPPCGEWIGRAITGQTAGA